MPAVVSASDTGVQERLEDYLFPVYRPLRGLMGSGSGRAAGHSADR